MENISNDQLLAELKRRFHQKDEAMQEQQALLAQLEKINRRLVQSEQVQSRFLSNIRNEINNPLTAILGMSQQMKTGVFENEKFQKTASLIFAESFRLNFQLQNIFLAAELEAGQSRPYLMDVQVLDMIDQTLKTFSHLVGQKKLTVIINHSLPRHFIFRTDPIKFGVILSNLLMNAIEFTGAGGEIILTASYSDENLNISIQDNGEGIPEQDLSNIFDRFVQLNNGTTKSHSGHGLGLSVVYSTLELFGGKINVVSNVGEGSVFHVTIPLSQPVAESRDASGDGNEFIFNSDEQIL